MKDSQAPKLIGFMGKGGTGKTTVTALFLKYLLQKKITPVLVIDADPNSCLPDLLSLKPESTIGNVKQDLFNKKSELGSKGLSKAEYCELAMENALVESKGFDLIAMGRPDGTGCYCYVNNIVTMMIEKLKRSYKYVVVDCEAGLEHLSRKTLGAIDIAFIISDVSRKGVQTAVNQVGLMEEIDINPENVFLLVNNVSENLKIPDLNDMLKTHDRIIPAGNVRHDELVSKFEFEQRSLLELPDDAVSFHDLKTILDKIGLF